MERSEYIDHQLGEQEGQYQRGINIGLGGLLGRAGPTTTSEGDGVVSVSKDNEDDDTYQEPGSVTRGSGSPQHRKSSAEPDWNRRLERRLQARLRQLEEARAPVKGAAVNYGASNYPHDPDVWIADWRDNLPEGDPRRAIGPPIVKSGSLDAYHKMKVASAAIRSAYGLPPEVDLP
jgi:hypothetical protein